MSLPLFKAMFKASARAILANGIGILIYEWVIAWVYPSISNNKPLNELLGQMPPAMLKAFGLEKGVRSFSDYMAAEFFNLIWLIIMAIFTVSLAVKLVSQMVDRGSMAFLLAAPLSRRKIILTQAAVLVMGVVLLAALTVAGTVVMAKLYGNVLNGWNYVLLGGIGALFFLVIGGYSLIASAALDDAKTASGLASGITVVFYGMNLAGKMGERLGWLKDWSLFNAFRPTEILDGSLHAGPYLLGLGAAAIALFGIAALIFKERDLSV